MIPKATPSDSRCGSVKGYAAHMKRKEYACDACREAQTIYAREWRHRTNRSQSKLYSSDEIQALQAEAWDEGVRAKSEYAYSDDMEPLTNPHRPTL